MKLSFCPVFPRVPFVRVKSWLYSSVRVRMFNLFFSAFGAGVWRGAEARGRASWSGLSPPQTGICLQNRPFLGTSVYFCSRAGWPMPRFLATNRTSGRASWFPPGLQTPLHISFGFPSPASKGNIWSPFCFAVTTGTSGALHGDSSGRR